MHQRPAVRSGLLATIAIGTLSNPAAAGLVAASVDRDATIYSGTAAIANGAGQYLFAGRTASGALRRALLRFDLSGLPSGAVVISATLRLDLTQAASGEHAISAHRIASAWTTGTSDPTGNEGSGAPATPGDTTWITRSFDVPGMHWSTPGGDFAAAASATSLVGVEPGWYSMESPGLADDVQAWLADPTSNHGWILIGDETVNQSARRFGSADGPAEFAPTLEVEFTVVPAPAAAFAFAFAGLTRPRRRR